MVKYFEDLHCAEFGYKSGDPEPLYPSANPAKMVSLLRRALTWKSHKNLELVCEYLGAECDSRTSTVDGCKAIICEDIEYWRGI